MPEYSRERDVIRSRSRGPTAGSQITIDYTYNARNEAFHDGVEELAKQFFANYRQSYSRRVGKRTGRLSQGFNRRTTKRYGREVVVSEEGLSTRVPYAFIYEYGGRGLHYKGSRRSGQIRRVFNTERRKLAREAKTLAERIYGA